MKEVYGIAGEESPMEGSRSGIDKA